MTHACVQRRHRHCTKAHPFACLAASPDHGCTVPWLHLTSHRPWYLQPCGGAASVCHAAWPRCSILIVPAHKAQNGSGLLPAPAAPLPFLSAKRCMRISMRRTTAMGPSDAALKADLRLLKFNYPLVPRIHVRQIWPLHLRRFIGLLPPPIAESVYTCTF